MISSRIVKGKEFRRALAQLWTPPVDRPSLLKRKIPSFFVRLGSSPVLCFSSVPDFRFEKFVKGPSLQLGKGTLAQQTHSSVVGKAGSTIVLCTVATEPSTDGSSFLTVEYRQRYHGVGKIPDVRSRKDNATLSQSEILASRAIDRALRPLLMESNEAMHFHVHASVQSCDLWNEEEYGHPLALAINTAAAAMSAHLKEPVAASVVAIKEGTIVKQDPIPSSKDLYGELLYVGTNNRIVMLEWTSHQYELPEHMWTDMLDLASATIQPLLLRIARYSTKESDEEDESTIRAALGLDVPEKFEGNAVQRPPVEEFVNGAVAYCQEKIGDAILILFGYKKSDKARRDRSLDTAFIHKKSSLLSKSARGKREQLILKEISRLSREYFEQQETTPNDFNLNRIIQKVQDTLLHDALAKATIQYGGRADNRGAPTKGWKTIRPIDIQVPALPPAVHGSSTFARGDTQVLCTVTLGPPSDGVPTTDPYEQAENPYEPLKAPVKASGYYSLPVGSLRFLRTQEALVSDLNSRRVKAEAEQIGDSGQLAEVKRAFLQYDFPAYSTGEVNGGLQSRRSTGHGALAEKAILPVLPSAQHFPYAIRMTSEVTDSNGSSSMATVCGTTLALLDAGVPLREPVAGVSVGAVKMNQRYGLLLDLTGTEDYYGEMDCKVAGTRHGVTALQLDVKTPLPKKVIIDALTLALSGRIALLDAMEQQSKSTLGGLKARREPKASAPQVEVIQFDPQRKRDLIGPSGVILRQLEDRYSVSLDLTQEGRCLMYGSNRDLVTKAKQVVMDLVADVVVGEVYEGIIIEIKDFGAIVELLRNKEGLLHVSELTDKEETLDHPDGLSGFVQQYMRVGQKVEVLCTDIDPVQGSIKLSRKALLKRRRALLEESSK